MAAPPPPPGGPLAALIPKFQDELMRMHYHLIQLERSRELDKKQHDDELKVHAEAIYQMNDRICAQSEIAHEEVKLHDEEMKFLTDRIKVLEKEVSEQKALIARLVRASELAQYDPYIAID